MKAGLDSAVEEDADGPEMEKDVKSDNAYDKHAPMLSMIKNGTSYYGVSRCIRGYSTTVSAPACHAGDGSSILLTRSRKQTASYSRTRLLI